MRALQRAVSLPSLVVAFVVLTLLSLRPLRPLEADLHGFWVRTYPDWVEWILQQVLDRLTGQAVCLPVLVIVAVVLARRYRTWRPILVAAATEVAFLGGVGPLKLLFARPSPELGNAQFFHWHWGLLDGGWRTSYPSGHSAEAILFYGAAAYLIIRYCRPSPRATRWIRAGVGLITVQSVVVAYLLGWHWTTDLPAGVLVGGILLHLVLRADRRLIPSLLRRWDPSSVDLDPGDLEDRQLRSHP
ncbi:phosphatase PAP2 family protein [Georgenia halophila]|uniref:Phosphatase PAP2 family protein n=1 Tax=Georgenia halophila TaxID=620889 RepID=A0ABP8KVM4_9MICO